MPTTQKIRQRSKPRNDDRLDFRLNSEAKRVIEQAAAMSGQTVKQFAVSTLVQSAEDVIERHRTIHLSNRDHDLFLALLDSDEQPNEEKAAEVSEQLGVHAVAVDALNEAARACYVKYGFMELLDDPLHLYLPMRKIRQLGL